MPGDMEMRDGRLWRRGRPLDTPTEVSFFAELGMPWWPPYRRNAATLSRYIHTRPYINYHNAHLAGE